MTTPLVNPPVSGLALTSDFESKSHEELRAMVEHAQPARAAEVAEKLKTAAAVIEEFGTLLQTEALSLTWEGEGGEAFRTWMADLGNATMRLGNFSRESGEWMGHAADTLSHVHSAMPAVSTDARTTLDGFLTRNAAEPGNRVAPPPQSDQTGGLDRGGPTQQQAYQAQQRLDADRAEAARLMRQLAGSYAWSAHQIQSLPGVTFPPMPLSPEWGGVEDAQRLTGSGPTPARNGSVIAGSAAPVSGPGPSVSDGEHLPIGHAYASAASGGHERAVASTAVHIPEQPVASRIDGAALLPHHPAEAPATMPSTLPAMPDGAAQIPPALLPPMPRPQPAVSSPRMPSGGQSAVGRPGTVSGAAGEMGRVAPGQASPRAPIVRIPGGASDGIIGGRPTPRGAEQLGKTLPRGTVVGAEPPGQAQAGGPLPHGPSAGPAAGGSVSRPGSGSGRRLAIEPGGVVGGRPQQREQGASRPFTPGGSGLVTEGRVSKQNSGSTSQRPGYVVEDEQTWSSGRRRVVPPVIE